MSLELGSGEIWARFAAASLATWRIAHLLAYEDGPGDVLVGLRARLGRGILGRLMDCFYCLSVWIALPLAPVVTPRLPDAVLVWVAISGAACLLERGTAPPIQVEPSSPDREEPARPRDVVE